jgi:hypothetical protein
VRERVAAGVALVRYQILAAINVLTDGRRPGEAKNVPDL